MEEALCSVDSRVEARADHDHRGLERLGGGGSEHLQALQRGGADRRRDLGGHGGERVEHLDGHLQHADSPTARMLAGNGVPSVIGISPQSSPGSRTPITCSAPFTSFVSGHSRSSGTAHRQHGLS